jgi:hypothetical protein
MLAISADVGFYDDFDPAKPAAAPNTMLIFPSSPDRRRSGSQPRRRSRNDHARAQARYFDPYSTRTDARLPEMETKHFRPDDVFRGFNATVGPFLSVKRPLKTLDIFVTVTVGSFLRSYFLLGATQGTGNANKRLYGPSDGIRCPSSPGGSAASVTAKLGSRPSRTERRAALSAFAHVDLLNEKARHEGRAS